VGDLNNRAAGWPLCGSRDRRILVQREVRAPVVIVIQEEFNRASQGPLIPDDDVIETRSPEAHCERCVRRNVDQVRRRGELSPRRFCIFAREVSPSAATVFIGNSDRPRTWVLARARATARSDLLTGAITFLFVNAKAQPKVARRLLASPRQAEHLAHAGPDLTCPDIDRVLGHYGAGRELACYSCRVLRPGAFTSAYRSWSSRVLWAR
jgi:hypothetical protein